MVKWKVGSSNIVLKVALNFRCFEPLYKDIRMTKSHRVTGSSSKAIPTSESCIRCHQVERHYQRKKEQDDEGFLRNVRYRCIDIHTEPAKHSTNDRIVEREKKKGTDFYTAFSSI